MRLSGVVAIVFVFSACQEKPTWSSVAIRRPDLCRLVQLSAVFVQLRVQSIDKPIKLEMSPWPQEPFWTTPVVEVAERVLLDARLPTEMVSIDLDAPIKGYFNGSLTSQPFPLIATATPIDDHWVFDLNSWTTFTKSADGWRRTDLEDDTVYRTADDLAAALSLASRSPECVRIDWVEGTRQANRARIAATGTSAANQPISGDAGP